MRSFPKSFTLMLLSATLAAPAITGCAVHARAYDPYYRDYHAWPAEQGYYNQWENDTHRRHEDFDRRDRDEQRQYWDWRHRHEHDHDHDQDR